MTNRMYQIVEHFTKLLDGSTIETNTRSDKFLASTEEIDMDVHT